MIDKLRKNIHLLKLFIGLKVVGALVLLITLIVGTALAVTTWPFIGYILGGLWLLILAYYIGHVELVMNKGW